MILVFTATTFYEVVTTYKIFFINSEALVILHKPSRFEFKYAKCVKGWNLTIEIYCSKKKRCEMWEFVNQFLLRSFRRFSFYNLSNKCEQHNNDEAETKAYLWNENKGNFRVVFVDGGVLNKFKYKIVCQCW